MIKYKVGDKIQSAKNSADVTTMKAVWSGKIYSVKCDNDNDGCYVTLGVWKPIVDENGEVDSFWLDHDYNEEPNFRQLHGNNLEAQS